MIFIEFQEIEKILLSNPITKIRARPFQNLENHIMNMLENIQTYPKQFSLQPLFNNILPKQLQNTIDLLFEETIQFLIFCHDLGKINPAFQIRMKNLELPLDKKIKKINDIKPYSYHLHPGFYYFIIGSTNYFALYWENNKKNLIENSFYYPIYQLIFNMFLLIGANVLLNHHNPMINSYCIGQITENEIKILNWQLNCNSKWIKYYSIKQSDKSSIPNFESYLNLLNNAIHNKESKNLGIIEYFVSNFSTIIKLDLPDDDFFEDLYIIKDKISDLADFITFTSNNQVNNNNQFNNELYYEEIQNYLMNFPKDSNNSFRFIFTDEFKDLYQIIIHNSEFVPLFYMVQRYLASILYDLDVWDAKYYMVDELKCNFELKTNLVDSSLVNQYRKKKFGINTDYNENYMNKQRETEEILLENKINDNPNFFTDFNLKNQKHILSLIREHLFYKINQTLHFYTEELNNNLTDLPHIYSVTAPTGTGKTLSLFHFAFNLQEILFKNCESKQKITPRIIYCLPFISISDQVYGIAQDLLDLDKNSFQTNRLIVHHHLSNKIWNLFEKNNQIITDYTKTDVNYFVNLWQADVVITTFVKLIESIFNFEKLNIQRFHRLLNSIIILDEVQSIPAKYWDIIRIIFIILSKYFNCHIILSTATQPKILEKGEYVELAENLLFFETSNKNLKNFYSHLTLNRYFLRFHKDTIDEIKFIEYVQKYIFNTQNHHLMIVVNKKNYAFLLFKEIFDFIQKNNLRIQPYLLSGYVLPMDRKETLNKVQEILNDPLKSKNVLLIATQVIEAGVDISFPTIFRDLAPLDSIVQVCGRCNRHGQLTSMGHVEIFQILDGEHLHAKQVYQDPIKMKHTIDLLNGISTDEEVKISNYTFPDCDCKSDHQIISEQLLFNSFSSYFDQFRKKGIKTNNDLF